MLVGHTGDFCYNRLDVAKGSAVAKLSKKEEFCLSLHRPVVCTRLPVSIHLKVTEKKKKDSELLKIA